MNTSAPHPLTKLPALRCPKILRRPLLLGLGVLTLGVTLGHAQCDKTVVLTGSKTEYLNAQGELQRTVDEQSILTFTKTEVTRREPGSDELKLQGKITAVTCDWKVPYKEGKTVIQATLREGDREEAATFTIEGKDGKVTLLAQIISMPDKQIRLAVESFTEAKK